MDSPASLAGTQERARVLVALDAAIETSNASQRIALLQEILETFADTADSHTVEAMLAPANETWFYMLHSEICLYRLFQERSAAWLARS